MNEVSKELLRVKAILGSFAIMGATCGVTGKAVEKWWKRGRLPRTEYTGETRYAELLAEATAGAAEIDKLRPPVKRDPADRAA